MVAYGVQVSSLHWEEQNLQRFCICICASKLFKHVFFSAQISCNHLSIPLSAFMNMCVLNYNENWAPNHCIKMFNWFLCMNFALAQISKGLKKLTSFVRPFFMSVPKVQPLRFNTFLRLEQSPRSYSSGNHHQWCQTHQLIFTHLGPLLLIVLMTTISCIDTWSRDSWPPHHPHWHVKWRCGDRV